MYLNFACLTTVALPPIVATKYYSSARLVLIVHVLNTVSAFCNMYIIWHALDWVLIAYSFMIAF